MFHLIILTVFVTFAFSAIPYQNNNGWHGGAPSGSAYGTDGYNVPNYNTHKGQPSASDGPTTQFGKFGIGQSSFFNQDSLASPSGPLNQFNNHGDAAVKGFNATRGQFPFQVSIMLREQHMCGGAIISPIAVVTAAHCVYQQIDSSLTVLAGTTNRLKGGIRSQIDKYIIHPQFNFNTKNFDIAIVFLKGGLLFGPEIHQVDLPQQDDRLYTNARLVISGWGTESGNGLISTNLKFVPVPLMDHEVCKRNLPTITNSMICVGELVGQRNSCPGDSGGPLTKENVLIGVMSLGYGCGTPGKPTVFTYVAGVRKWISEIARV